MKDCVFLYAMQYVSESARPQTIYDREVTCQWVAGLTGRAGMHYGKVAGMKQSACKKLYQQHN